MPNKKSQKLDFVTKKRNSTVNGTASPFLKTKKDTSVQISPPPGVNELITNPKTKVIFLEAKEAVDSRNFSRAIAKYESILSIESDNPFLYYCLVTVYRAFDQSGTALYYAEKGIEKLEHHSLLMHKAELLTKLNRQSEAMDVLLKIIKIAPKHSLAYFHMAVLSMEVDNHEQSINYFTKATELDPKNAEYFRSFGIGQYLKGRYYDCIMVLETAHKLDKEDLLTLNALGEVYGKIRMLDKSQETFEKAIAIIEAGQKRSPKEVEAVIYNGLACFYNRKRDFKKAVETFDKALIREPKMSVAISQKFMAQANLCDWNNFEEICDDVNKIIIENAGAIAPFILFMLPKETPPEIIYKANTYIFKTEVVEKVQSFDHSTLPPRAERQARDKIRIGYVSSDFHTHATAILMAELFEQHDKTKFEVYAYSGGIGEAAGGMQERLKKSFDVFREIRHLPILESASMIINDDIDILIDLKGHTQDNKMELFALRLAPVQIHYLGFPSTLGGVDHIDYMFLDSYIAPFEQQPYYAENIVHLPNCYQVNDRTRKVVKSKTRSDYGIPEDKFVFCCFNNMSKHNPDSYDVWMDIMKQVPNSVLLLLSDSEDTNVNLRIEAEKRGVCSDRLHFFGYISPEEHLGRISLCDLFLDNYPCNAHTTASDSLWAGCPILTRSGNTAMAARVAGSLLSAMDLPELITTNWEDYKAKALELANNPEKLRILKAKIQANRETHPLFDSLRFTRNYERALETIWQIHLAGLAPQPLKIADIQEVPEFDYRQAFTDIPPAITTKSQKTVKDNIGNSMKTSNNATDLRAITTPEERRVPVFQNNALNVLNTRHGFLAISEDDTGFGKTFMQFGEWQEGLHGLVGQLLQPDDLIVEYGAGNGAHSLFFASKIGVNGAVLAFEPRRLLFQQLCTSVTLNNTANIYPINKSLGIEIGEAFFPILQAGQTVDYRLIQDKTGESEDDLPQESALQSTLDQMQLPFLKLLCLHDPKLACAALEGARETLQGCTPFLLVRNDDLGCSRAIIEALQAQGYNLWWHISRSHSEDNYFGSPVVKDTSEYSAYIIGFHSKTQVDAGNLQKVLNSGDTYKDALRRILY